MVTVSMIGLSRASLKAVRGDRQLLAGTPALRWHPATPRCWSTFLMFHLQRPDVLPVGDLGIRRAVMVRYGLDELPTPPALEIIASPWRPHRTLACRFLWRSLDAVPA